VEKIKEYLDKYLDKKISKENISETLLNGFKTFINVSTILQSSKLKARFLSSSLDLFFNPSIN
jgi:hypothetical protein